MPCFKFYLSCREMFQKFLTSIKKFNLHKIVKFSDSNFNTCWMHCIFFFAIYMQFILLFPSSILIETNDIYDPLGSLSIQCIVMLLISDIYIYLYMCVVQFDVIKCLLHFLVFVQICRTCVFDTRPSKSSIGLILYGPRWVGGWAFLSFVTFYLFC